MEKTKEERDTSCDSQDSNGNDGFERRGILRYDRINVRNLNLNEVVSRMNQLRQNPCSLEGVASSSTSRPPASGTSSSPSTGTSIYAGNNQGGSSSSSPRSGGGNISPQVTFYPEFKKKNASLEPLNLDNIPAACARNELVSPRFNDIHMHPFRVQFFGYQSGDAASSPRIRLPPVISPIRYPRGNPRLFPRHPLGLGYGSRFRSYATREFFASEFGRKNSKENFALTEQKNEFGQFKERQPEEPEKSENKEESKKSANTEESKKSANTESGKGDLQEESSKSGNKEEPESSYHSE